MHTGSFIEPNGALSPVPVEIQYLPRGGPCWGHQERRGRLRRRDAGRQAETLHRLQPKWRRLREVVDVCRALILCPVVFQD